MPCGVTRSSTEANSSDAGPAENDVEAWPVFEGALVAGKYRVERVLGRGGMGVVLGAKHIELGELVAIKVIKGGIDDFIVVDLQFNRNLVTAERIVVVKLDIRIFQMTFTPRVFVIIDNCFAIE